MYKIAPSKTVNSYHFLLLSFTLENVRLSLDNCNVKRGGGVYHRVSIQIEWPKALNLLNPAHEHPRNIFTSSRRNIEQGFLPGGESLLHFDLRCSWSIQNCEWIVF